MPSRKPVRRATTDVDITTSVVSSGMMVGGKTTASGQSNIGTGLVSQLGPEIAVDGESLTTTADSSVEGARGTVESW